jgi:hypothetical protein
MFRRPLIEFAYHEVFDGVLPPVAPAVQHIPDEYRSMPRKDNRYLAAKRSTVRACMPFFDAMTAGFILPWPVDVRIRADEEGIHYFYNASMYQHDGRPSESPVWVTHHPDFQTSPLIPDPVIKVMSPYFIRTRRGWGSLFLPLLNRDMPFVPIAGLVNTNKYRSPVNIVGMWKGGYGDFDVEQGTPMAQVIPVPLRGTTYRFGALDAARAFEFNQDGHYCALTGDAYKRRMRDKVVWKKMSD